MAPLRVSLVARVSYDQGLAGAARSYGYGCAARAVGRVGEATMCTGESVWTRRAQSVLAYLLARCLKQFRCLPYDRLYGNVLT